MPSSNQPQDVYLKTIDETLSQISPSLPLVVASDLNCQLGHLGVPDAWTPQILEESNVKG